MALGAATAASAQPLATPMMPAPIADGTQNQGQRGGNFIRERVGVQAAYTDNVNRTSSDKESDTIGRITAGLDGQYDGPRAKGNVTGDVVYDAYVKNQKYDTLSFNGVANAQYILVPETLAIEAAGANTQGSSSTFGSTDFYRNGSPADYQLGSYYVGPHLTISPGLVDIAAAARYGQTFFDGSDISSQEALARNTSFYQVIGAADTKDRLGRIRLVASAQYQGDDDDFTSTSGSVSGFVQATDRLTGIVRLGYDSTSLNSTQDLDKPFWAVGGQFNFGPGNFVRLEGGRRYGRAYWGGQARYQPSRRFILLGSYTSVLETGALAVNGVLVDYVGSLNDPLPLPNIQRGFRLNTNYYDQAAINQTGNVRALIDLGRSTIAFDLNTNEQKFLISSGSFRTITESVVYSNQVRPDLLLSLEFSHALGSFHGGAAPGVLDSDGNYYETAARADYGLNSRTRLTAAIENRRSRPGGTSFVDSYDENIASIAIVRQF